MILKPSFYDEFYCIGGDCSFTCCMDWEIRLDRDETERHAMADGVRNEEPLKIDPDGTSALNFEGDGRCPFLNENGLCRLVLEHGEEFISHTCHVFPRFETSYNDVYEMHLSNACPAVLDFFLRLPSPMTFVAEEDDSGIAVLHYEDDMILLRDRCIDLMQLNELPIWSRLYMLQRFSGRFDKTGDANKTADDMINATGLVELYRSVSSVEVPPEKTLTMLCQVIREIGCYKNDLRAYKTYIKRIEPFIDELANPEETVLKKWDDYGKLMSKYEVFFEHFFVNYTFTHTEHMFDPDSFDVTVKTMLLEYVLIRGVLFLIYLETGNISDTDVKNISAFYARMYEHGLVGTEGFVRENLDNPWFSEGGFLTMIK